MNTLILPAKRDMVCNGVFFLYGVKPSRHSFERRDVSVAPVRPTIAAMIPPMSIQTALSVGAPVKNLETSELKESMAAIPKAMSTMPPTTSAKEMELFIMAFPNHFS